MNLSDFCSHPEYPYEKHRNNVFNTFSDSVHENISQFHDAGKLSDNFQNKVLKGKGKTTHSIEGAFIFLIDILGKKENININDFISFWSIAAHHTGLENFKDFWRVLESYERLTDKYYDFDKNYFEVKERLNIISKIEPKDLCEEYFDKEEDSSIYPFLNKEIIEDKYIYFKMREIFSKLVFADRHEAIFKDCYVLNKQFNINNYINCLKLKFGKIDNKKKKINNIRNDFRKVVLKNYEKNKDQNVFILEAPTGIGKTLTSLSLALQIAKDKNKKKIITALPMTSIIDQTYDIYCDILGEENVLKDHYLADIKNDADENELQQNNFMMNSWAGNDFIVTTFNRFFYALFSSNISDMFKLWTLRDSVIILDEVQNIPRILLKDIAYVLSAISDFMNIDFILMSATMPYIKYFLPNSIELSEDSFFKSEHNNRYSLEFSEDIKTVDELSNFVYEDFINNDSVLCVVNTKKTALDVYELLAKKNIDNLYLLSGYFTPIHRKIKIRCIKNKLLKNEKLILISTQVIEAGVDLDFDRGYREFSPLASIIQTAGRVNREGLLEIKNVTVFPKICKKGPYNQADLLEDVVKPELKKGYSENTLIDLLRNYFNHAKDGTSPDFCLKDDMDCLNFSEVSKKFKKIFMPENEFYKQIFIETKQGVYKGFENKFNEYKLKIKKSDSLEERLKYKLKLKKLFKKIGRYIINIPEIEAKSFKQYWVSEDIYFCRYEELNDNYDFKKGWKMKENSCKVL